MIGRMCTGCAPMSVKATFTDLSGKESSAVGTVKCDGEPVTVWQGTAPCHVGAYDYRVCSAGARAMCSRSGNGNLIATIKQEDCEAPCPPHALKSSWEDEEAPFLRVDRRLLSRRARSADDCFPQTIKCRGAKASKSIDGGVSTSSASVTATVNDVKNKASKCGIISKHKKKMADCQDSVTCAFD